MNRQSACDNCDRLCIVEVMFFSLYIRATEGPEGHGSPAWLFLRYFTYTFFLWCVACVVILGCSVVFLFFDKRNRLSLMLNYIQMVGDVFVEIEIFFVAFFHVVLYRAGCLQI